VPAGGELEPAGPAEVEKRDGLEIALVDVDPRWREAWLLHARGLTVREIGKRLDVSASAAAGWVRKFAALERARQADFEHEKSRLTALFDNAAEQSLRAFESLDPEKKTASEHMANHLRALQMGARVRGMEASARQVGVGVRTGSDGEAEIVIRVGGDAMVRRRMKKDEALLNGQAIAVEAREVDRSGDAGRGAGAAPPGEGADPRG
jgi:predicted transcriptional regulator